ncbi:DNA cytosine methyltransferase [Streptomyces netropsis]|uniref:DNA (cytosine-5-)-methyltransferase n=1 Tax=Streptomyces netropsis TaxID=55404 RepID=A0A7W7PG98_STRNE|nr:DNA (cytosine-5-)-methyltransferase [Streptomyces netropsis]MBB4887510.1 DNA (cytosine-5)-methyltransferase 1 [Streptomyces netropsis]GGR35270.1 cytosine-specific methyltransferase [Streptomyces netropsis]
MAMPPIRFTSFEICAGAGGQALGLEQAGFDPVLLIDSNAHCCRTLHQNRPHWNVLQADVMDFDPAEHDKVYDVDLLSGGLPRVKSAATIQRADSDTEWKLLQAAVWMAHSVQPRAVLLENVPELVTSEKYASDREWIEECLSDQGYRCSWQVLNSADFGVPQYRKQGFLVALRDPHHSAFRWPEPNGTFAPTVGEALGSSMASRGWPGASAWAAAANKPGPALVGGSDKRGGADLGPTGQKKAWARLGVEGKSIADDVPGPHDPIDLLPMLDVRQAATLQSFPTDWTFHGRKTSVYRQVGHASPPPVAEAVGKRIAQALSR